MTKEDDFLSPKIVVCFGVIIMGLSGWTLSTVQSMAVQVASLEGQVKVFKELATDMKADVKSLNNEMTIVKTTMKGIGSWPDY